MLKKPQRIRQRGVRLTIGDTLKIERSPYPNTWKASMSISTEVGGKFGHARKVRIRAYTQAFNGARLETVDSVTNTVSRVEIAHGYETLACKEL